VIVLTFEAAGYRDAAGRWAKKSRKLVESQRAMAREQSRELVAALREEAPKKEGTFAAGIRYRTTLTPSGVRSTIYVGGEHAFLLPIIVRGSRAHEIPMGGALAQLAKGYPLRFFWEDGPRGPDVYYFWRVWHPGTKPDDFVQRALDERWPHIQEALRKVARSVAYEYDVPQGEG
jgi:hypothetical protein